TDDVWELSQRLNESPVKDELIAAVDDWALDEKDPKHKKRLDEIAAAATGEDWRRQLLQPRKDLQALKQCAERLKQSGGSPAQMIRLAQALDECKLDSLPLLEAGSRLYPSDFSLHFARATRYHDPSRRQYDAAGGAYHAALA